MFLGEPLGFFISSCYHFSMFSFLHSFRFHFFVFFFLLVFVFSDVSSLFVLLQQVLRIWERIFYSPPVFSLHTLHAFIHASLGPAVQPWRLLVLPLRFQQTRNICFFQSHMVWQLYDSQLHVNFSNYFDKLLVGKSLINFNHIS